MENRTHNRDPAPCTDTLTDDAQARSPFPTLFRSVQSVLGLEDFVYSISLRLEKWLESIGRGGLSVSRSELQEV